MQWQEWSDIIPASELQLLDKGRQQEIEQPLIDLGYLSVAANTRLDNQSFQQEYCKSIQKFRAAYFVSNLQNKTATPLLSLPTNELDSEELHLLHQLVGLDGNVAIPTMPKLGQQNLWTHVLHYRLIVLGLFSGSVSTTFNEESMAALKLLGEWLIMPIDNPLAIINLAGDVPLLTEKILQSGKLRNHVVTFKYNKAKTNAEVFQEVREEQEENEDEAALESFEKEIEKGFNAVDKKLFSKEEATWEAMENKTKRKQKRINRIEGKMTKLLKKEQKLLTEGLEKELVIQNKIKQLTGQEKVLAQSLAQAKRAVVSQQEVVKTQNKNSKKKLASSIKEKKKLSKNIAEPKQISSALVLISQASQNNRIRNQNVQHLKENNGKKSVIKSMESDISKAEKEIARLQTNIKTLKQIDRLEEEIKLLRRSSTSFNLAQQKLDLIKEEKKKTEQLIASVQKNIKSNREKFNTAKKEREQSIGEQQLKLQQLNKRFKRLLEKAKGLSYRFKAQLRRSLNESFYQEIRQKVFRDRRTDYLEQVASSPFNLFLVRLIQVRQWMNGYYYGRLDSQPGDRTFQSIVEFTEEEDLKKLRLKYILTRLGQNQKGFWLLNVQYYFDCLVTLDHKASSETSTSLITLYEKEIEKENGIFNNKRTKKAWEEYNLELQEGLDGPAHRIRRFYFGVKSLIKSIGRVIHRVIRFLIKGVKIVLRILKNFIKIIYKEIREGTKNFFDGMQFLFGKRSIETVAPNGSIVLTNYGFDFDTTVFMSTNLPQETLNLHIQECMKRTHNLHFSLTLCGKVLKWVFHIATSSLSWPRLAIKIAFYFKGLIIKFFKERKRRLTGTRPIVQKE